MVAQGSYGWPLSSYLADEAVFLSLAVFSVCLLRTVFRFQCSMFHVLRDSHARSFLCAMHQPRFGSSCEFLRMVMIRLTTNLDDGHLRRIYDAFTTHSERISLFIALFEA